MTGSERDSEACGLEASALNSGPDGHHIYSIIRIKCSALSTTIRGPSERFNCIETISLLRFPDNG